MIAVENHQSGSTSSEKSVKIQAVKPGTRADGVRYLFIVGRDEPELYDRLARDFSEDKEVQVLLDRRLRERRRGGKAQGPERRRAGRRRKPEGWTVPVPQLYRGERPCLLLVAEEPVPSLSGRREDGSSFFRPGKGPAKPEDAGTRAHGGPGGNDGGMAEASKPLPSPWESAGRVGSGR